VVRGLIRRRRRGRRRRRMTGSRTFRPVVAAAIAFLAGVTLAATASAQEITEEPVLTTPAGEFQPARTDGALAWERNTKARPNQYQVMVRADGGQVIQVNHPSSSAALGDFLGERVVYQQYRGNPRASGRSDLHLFDISSGSRSKLGGVNSRQWEYWPSSSGAWLLFARWNPTSDARRLILHNLDTGERRILDRVRGRRAFLGPGQVNGNNAVWYVCRRRCNVFRYDITDRAETVIGNPGSNQRAPSVTPAGTVYFSRGGRRCGASVTLVRESLQGDQTVLLRLQDGLDIADTYAYVAADGATELYYERNVCGRPAGSDIYRIRETARATLTVQVTGGGTVISSPAGINCGADCSEDYERGTTVTLVAHPASGWAFTGWGGACVGTAPCTLQMDAAKDVTATFAPSPAPPQPAISGSITVLKVADPSDGTMFLFDTAPNISGGGFSLADGQSRTFIGLGTGTYQVTERPVEDWDVEGIQCSGGGSDTESQQQGRRARIALDPGEAAQCSFFNEED
jgi:Divergent InlB B-repeat domain